MQDIQSAALFLKGNVFAFFSPYSLPWGISSSSNRAQTSSMLAIQHPNASSLPNPTLAILVTFGFQSPKPELLESLGRAGKAAPLHIYTDQELGNPATR